MRMQEAKIFVVDDEQQIVRVLRRALELAGFSVQTAACAEDALPAIALYVPDIVITDLNMPGMGGLELCRTLRTSSQMPIIILSVKGDEHTKVQALDSGADDYVSKPFEPRELSLRVASILRRAKPAAAPSAESLRFGEFVFHIGRAELRKGDDVVRLTDREREMLTVLASAPGETVPRMALAGSNGSVNERAVDVQVNRLRRKIEHDPTNPLIVQTVRGIGYRLVVSP